MLSVDLIIDCAREENYLKFGESGGSEADGKCVVFFST